MSTYGPGVRPAAADVFERGSASGPSPAGSEFSRAPCDNGSRRSARLDGRACSTWDVKDRTTGAPR